MLLWPLLLLCAGAAEPAPSAVGVVVLHRSDVTDAEVSALVTQLRQKLATKGALNGKRFLAEAKVLPAAEKGSDPCAGAQDCARAVGARLGLAMIIGVDLAASRRSSVLHLEAVLVADGSRVATRDVVAPREGTSRQLVSSLDSFASDVVNARLPFAEVAAPEEVKPASDLPRKAELPVVVDPRPARQPEEAVASAGSSVKSRHGAAWGCGGGALVVAIVSAGLAAGGAVQAAKLNPGADGAVAMTYSQAQQTATRANGLYIAGASTAAVAVALAVAAIVLRVSDDEVASPP